MEMDPPPQSSIHPAAAAGDRRRCREYLLALEEERLKIQVFQRELPLCLDLVTQSTHVNLTLRALSQLGARLGPVSHMCPFFVSPFVQLLSG
jgi:hypothetical protein